MPLKFWKKKDSQPSISPPTPTSGYTPYPLRNQHIIRSPAETKIRYAILATALVDALGGPPEFKPRFSFEFVTTFTVNLNFRDEFGELIQPGVWTDDTSMTLCLASSIARHGFNEAHQLDAYLNWYRKGELSAIGYCFDIGGTTGRALRIHESCTTKSASLADASESLQRIQETLSDGYTAGNGSLMRIIPIGLAFWRNPALAREYARRSSRTTHPTSLCLEVCELWTAAVTQIMQHACNSQTAYSKFELLRYISEYPTENQTLKAALGLPADAHNNLIGSTTDNEEERYWKHHPILRLIAETRDSLSARKTGYLKLPAPKALPASGYILHSLVAALYCFLATDNFETGAVMAVNLGDDADTTGAIYAGLAGCWYAEDLPPNGDMISTIGTGLFWSQLVRAWRLGLMRRDLVEGVAEELVQFERSWQSELA